MSQFLVFCLHGPLCSWGGVAVGELRMSQAHPTRSAVLGLVAGALGLRREREDDLLALDASLGLALRVLHPGRPLTDFHTVEMPSTKIRGGVRHATRRAELIAAKQQNDNPMLSFREYRADSLHLACLWETQPRPPWPLEAILPALERPVFTPYLGRKSCPPALPFAPQLVEAADARQALAADRSATLEAAVLARLPRPGGPGDLFWDADDNGAGAGLTEQADEVFTRRDRLHSRRRWQFIPRREARAPWSEPAPQEE